MSKAFYGIGSEEVDRDDELYVLNSPKHPKHPADVNERVDRILEYVEQMQVTARDNNAILHQMMTSMEERLNRKIDKLREEMIELIRSTNENNNNTNGAISTKGTPPSSNTVFVSAPQVAAPTPTKSPARRASALEVRTRADKYSVPLTAPLPSPTKTETFYEMISIVPHPGFVVKTRKLLGEKNKVFINIFHHPLIALNPPGLATEKATDKPYMMMDAPSTTVDHAGVSCVTFNVGISSEYFTQPNPNVDIIITAPKTIYKVTFSS